MAASSPQSTEKEISTGKNNNDIIEADTQSHKAYGGNPLLVIVDQEEHSKKLAQAGSCSSGGHYADIHSRPASDGSLALVIEDQKGYDQREQTAGRLSEDASNSKGKLKDAKGEEAVDELQAGNVEPKANQDLVMDMELTLNDLPTWTPGCSDDWVADVSDRIMAWLRQVQTQLATDPDISCGPEPDDALAAEHTSFHVHIHIWA